MGTTYGIASPKMPLKDPLPEIADIGNHNPGKKQQGHIADDPLQGKVLFSSFPIITENGNDRKDRKDRGSVKGWGMRVKGPAPVNPLQCLFFVFKYRASDGHKNFSVVPELVVFNQGGFS